MLATSGIIKTIKIHNFFYLCMSNDNHIKNARQKIKFLKKGKYLSYFDKLKIVSVYNKIV